MRLLAERGETLDSFVFRDATIADIPALAELHAVTWSQTYPNVRKPPTAALREYQWREQFEKKQDNWFCLLVTDREGGLVGFAKGIISPLEDQPGYNGEINKIYLLQDYQRLGLGRRLMGHLVRRFLSMGATRMSLFGVAENPSIYFHEAMGGERLYNDKGGFDGGYQWRILKSLQRHARRDVNRETSIVRRES
jgi:ribosomal protein S18 acetylase RimI-like enzyme